MAFAYKGTFTVTSSSGLLPSSQSNFPLLVSVTNACLKTVGNGGQVQHTVTFNGQTVPADVVFKLASDLTGAAMSYDVAFYDPAAGTLIAWVLKSTLALGDLFYAGIGDASISTYQGGSVGAAWNSNLKGGWHGGDGTTLNLKDSTGVNDGTNHSATADPSGAIDGAIALSGSSQWVDVGNNASLQITGAITISAWVKPTDRANYYMVLCKTSGGLPAPYEYFLNITDGVPWFFEGNGVIYSLVVAGAAPATGQWHLIAVTWDGVVGVNAGDVEHYLDGAGNTGSTAVTTVACADGGNNALIGSRDDFFSYFKGSIGEVRIWNAVLTPDWIKAEYNNQSDPTTFVGSSFSALTPAVDHVGSMLAMFQ